MLKIIKLPDGPHVHILSGNNNVLEGYFIEFPFFDFWK